MDIFAEASVHTFCRQIKRDILSLFRNIAILICQPGSYIHLYVLYEHAFNNETFAMASIWLFGSM